MPLVRQLLLPCTTAGCSKLLNLRMCCDSALQLYEDLDRGNLLGGPVGFEEPVVMHLVRQGLLASLLHLPYQGSPGIPHLCCLHGPKGFLGLLRQRCRVICRPRSPTFDSGHSPCGHGAGTRSRPNGGLWSHIRRLVGIRSMRVLVILCRRLLHPMSWHLLLDSASMRKVGSGLRCHVLSSNVRPAIT